MNELRNLPKIDEFLVDSRLIAKSAGVAPGKVTEIVRGCVDNMRKSIILGKPHEPCRSELYEHIIADALLALDEYTSERLISVINATGVIIHTNLGRAPLSQNSSAHAFELATGYTNLELSVKTGARRNRLAYVERMLCDLTGAEAALVVNNNAAAVFLIAAALCAGKGVLLSRGEIVEIGDSFRIADIIGLSGCKIIEIGTTNRTYISDYERALSTEIAAIAKIHTSNYKITGYTSEVSAGDLQKLADKHGIFMFEDMGSGIMADLRPYGLPYERTAADAISDQIGVVTISGDKMLGGPQAGIILGREKYLSLMKKSQLLRCLRIDKLSLAVLEATLIEYTKKTPNILVLELIKQHPDDLKLRAKRLCAALSTIDGFEFALVAHTAQIGGGALPGLPLKSWGVLAKSLRFGSNKLEGLLRGASPPVIATLQPDGVMLDVIAIPDSRINDVVSAIKQAANLQAHMPVSPAHV